MLKEAICNCIANVWAAYNETKTFPDFLGYLWKYVD